MSEPVTVKITGTIMVQPQEGSTLKELVQEHVGHLGFKVEAAEIVPPAPVCPHCGGGKVFSKYRDGGSVLYCASCGEKNSWPNPHFRRPSRGW